MRAPALLSVFLLAAPAIGQGLKTSGPIDFGADHIELQDRANRAVLSGNVAVKQANMTLNAARMTIAYVGQVTGAGGRPEATRVDASGGVTVRRPGQTARSQYAIYDLNRRVITMLGAVTLTQGGNTVNGGRLTINLNTDRAVIDGSSVAGSTGAGATPGVEQRSGRVTGTFSVPDRN